MNFTDIMKRILLPFTGNDGFYYEPYINGGDTTKNGVSTAPDIHDPGRGDYNDTSETH